MEFVEEILNESALKEVALKQKIASRHRKKKKKVIKREFEAGDLILGRNQKDSEDRKLAANWEGPNRIRL